MKGFCVKCDIELTSDNCCQSTLRKGGSYCRACDNLIKRERYKEDPSKFIQRNARYLAANREKHNAAVRNYFASLSEEQKRTINKKNGAAIRFRKCGASLQYFESKIVEQNNLCMICKRIMGNTSKLEKACQDHSHDTGQLRDVLCGRCNLMLGNIKEDKEILASAIQYLRKWEGDNSNLVSS
jgi:hypothetical protein